MMEHTESFNNFFRLYNNDLLTLTDYTFDGKYFENIEKIGVFQPIIKLKNALKQGNKEEINEC